jgi:hypothetical protein
LLTAGGHAVSSRTTASRPSALRLGPFDTV